MAADNRRTMRALLKQSGTTYPRIVNVSKSLRSRIDRTLRDTAYQAISDWDPGTSIVEAVNSYKTTLNTDGFLSVRFDAYYFPELAAHGATGVSSVTLSLNTGKVYRFEDLFRRGSDYQQIIDQIIQAQIIEQQIPMLKPFEGVGPDQEYYLTPDSLVIYYQPYVYTPGAYGVLEFTIPYAQISGIVCPVGPIGVIIAS
ncbi:MAG TPA: RsiV family protein [Bacillota bacterium]|nr:RsiV family protein [Bacillota bacterium]